MAHDSITQVRDLRTGMAVWAAYPSPRVETRVLRRPLVTDVVVVGAGITGAMVAEATTAAGFATVLLDRRPPGQGSTAASTALLQYEIDTPLTHLADRIGMADAARAWRRSYRAVQDLTRKVGTLDLPCALQSHSALYLAGDLLQGPALVEEGRQRAAIGLPCRHLTHRELARHAGIDREGALLSAGAAAVNPAQLTQALLARAVAQGAVIYSPAELAEVVPLRKGVQMATADGLEIAARALIYATGYELADDVPSRGHRHTSTWAFATPAQPQALWPQRDLIWEAAEPYLYIRTTIDGRVVVGGEDESFESEARRDAAIATKIAALQEKTRRLLPGIDVTAEFAWAGTFGESEDGLPSIGAVPGKDNCYAVLGYGGNGITFSVMAAQIIVGLLAGQPDADTDLFGFR